MIPRKKIETDFGGVLKELQPTRGLVQMATAMFKDCWNMQFDQAAVIGKAFKREALEVEKKIEQLIGAVVEATNPRVIAAYEQRIEKLERKKLVLQEKEREMDTPPESFDHVFEHSMRFLSNPWKLWKTGRFDLQRLVLKLTFSEHLQYCRETGFRTPKTTLPFSMLGDFCMPEKQMVPPA